MFRLVTKINLKVILLLVTALFSAVAVTPLSAQPIRALQQGDDAAARPSMPGRSPGPAIEDVDLAGEFAFVRVQYDSYFRGGFGYGPWSVDFPDADRNFLRGVARLSHVRVMPEPIVLRLDDDQIFEYPFLYALEVGRNGGPFFTPPEINNLREYLLRGGFLLIDDFWGTREWEAFESSIRMVFPDRELERLAPDHEIFRIYYDTQGPQMIPALGNPDNMAERDVDTTAVYAIRDDDDRIMVLVNWNTDMGDGWEHTYHPRYPTRYANLSYQMGLNYLIYSLTH